ncbi:TniQ family protein [Nocardia tengchongensis]|uniref:TniQ family protein n=1 Tax=Nocardia tengchongensis TaxID=2055889 RepID=UPI00361FD943
MRAAPRWPLHPPPGTLESLSSWLARIAEAYGVPVAELLGPNLGVLAAIPEMLDQESPPELLAALSQRTGVAVGRLAMMTLPGWVPWLFDSYPMAARDAEETFDNYVRQYSVLLAPGEATRFELTRRRTWRGPWIPAAGLNRSCPLCTAAPEPVRALVWDLPLTIGCTQHRRRLLSSEQVAQTQFYGQDLLPVPIAEPVATVENYTHQGLTTGRVALPGRTVHAGVWFRLLRCLLDELSLSTNPLRKAPAHILAQVWEAAELPERAGMRMWQPYESLPWPRQEDLLTAAAVAVELVAAGRIHPRGVLGPLLRAPVHDSVYPGDDPARARTPVPIGDLRSAMRVKDWAAINDLVADVERAMRTDPDTARDVLAFLVAFDPTPARIAEERELFIRKWGVPAHFLRTRAETESLLTDMGHEPGEIARVLTEYAEEAPRRGVSRCVTADLFTPDDLGQLRARLEL